MTTEGEVATGTGRIACYSSMEISANSWIRWPAAGVADNTIVVFAGDNGNEEALLHRGTSLDWEEAYFTGMEASLRTPCIARWPGHIAADRESNEIMHVTDWLAALLSMTGLTLPGRPRRQGPNSISARRAKHIEPGRLHLLER